MSNYVLTIVESGSGDEFTVGTFASLEDCDAVLSALDKRHEKWCAAGFPKLAEDDLLRHYEGCDVYATDTDGRGFFEDGYGHWEEDL